MTLFSLLFRSVFSSGLAFFALSQAALAETVVEVVLWDNGPDAMEMSDSMMPMGMAMSGANMVMAAMGITVEIAELPAGQVKFEVVNDSQEFYHSMTISRIEDPAVELPYLTDAMMVDEAAAGVVAESSELRPHASGFFTVDLPPGTYILYCNIAGHYMMGMWTLITVA